MGATVAVGISAGCEEDRIIGTNSVGAGGYSTATGGVTAQGNGGLSTNGGVSAAGAQTTGGYGGLSSTGSSTAIAAGGTGGTLTSATGGWTSTGGSLASSGGSTGGTGGMSATGGSTTTGGSGTIASGIGGTGGLTGGSTTTGGSGTIASGIGGTGGFAGSSVNTGGSVGSGGSAPEPRTPCEKISGVYVISGVASYAALLSIAPNANGGCSVMGMNPGDAVHQGTLEWVGTTVVAKGSPLANHLYFPAYNSWNLKQVTIDLKADGTLVGSGLELIEANWGNTPVSQTYNVSLVPTSGTTRVLVQAGQGVTLPWSPLTVRSATFDRDLNLDLKPLTGGSGIWTKVDAAGASTDLSEDWDALRGSTIPIETVPGAMDDTNLPFSGGTSIAVADIGPAVKSIAFSTLPPFSNWGVIVASPAPAGCGTNGCIYLPNNSTLPDTTPSAQVVWQMDSTGTSKLVITCFKCSSSNFGAGFHTLPASGSVASGVNTTDMATGTTTIVYSYSGLKRLGITVSGSDAYLISAAVR